MSVKWFYALLLMTPLLTQCASKSSVSADDLKAPFIDHRAEIDGCYQKVLKKQPDLSDGKVEMKFLINEEGKAYKTIYLKRSTLESKLLNACIKKTVATWQFPKGQKVEVVYPFQFERSDESKPAPAKTDDMDIINTSPPEEGSGDEGETPAE